jgi:hypothetical protein
MTPLLADEITSSSEAEHSVHGRNHLSVLLANTHVTEEGNNATVGIDYEYRVNKLLGVGAIIERAYGELNATTVLAVADIHFHNGLIMQVGPGVELAEDENVFVSRVGILYEYEIEHYTISPQLHWDYHHDESNAVIAGLALGFSF